MLSTRLDGIAIRALWSRDFSSGWGADPLASFENMSTHYTRYTVLYYCVHIFESVTFPDNDDNSLRNRAALYESISSHPMLYTTNIYNPRGRTLKLVHACFSTLCLCVMQCCAVTRAWSVDSCTRTQKVRNFRVVLCCSIPSEVIQLPRKLMLCSCQRCSGPWTWRIWFMKPIL